ncbi:MAG: hypothetical protein COV02_00470 [Candidatus Terrybacteria bacterium CG10_big_fil_rev_8_21_14_0_10_41_10]|uniref:Phospho-N-acetylmuramoyl-pentapeptide-transferase n=1 Tax=Candidatus Terrybacteria bacterium CG10_big_fil_rev_8_21_14_0_10_41_10 TaxID=1975026 RepID=A0A2M8LB37_9BACT|nr:MAG: hypothetical protein COV02_00470 [Candidatus Terrybacteria bacterium CG10_big_fil_rev_8_21_14_0_10_41_10]
MALDIFKILGLSAFSFLIGVSLTPLLTSFLYKYKLWKKQPRKNALSGGEATVFNQIHKEKEVGTPRMGGMLIWLSVAIIAILFSFLAETFPGDLMGKLNFLSRNQTWLPIFTLIAGSLIGFFDDLFVVLGSGKYSGGGISLVKRLFFVGIIGLVGALWFYYKLEVSNLLVPFVGNFDFGILFIPFFVLVMYAIFSGGVIDGIDGLSGGIFAAIFSAYGAIAFFQNQINLAALCGIIAGGILAFLWFNIPPARFYMGETGIIGLTTTLTVIAFLTDAVAVLPIIAFPLFAASGSVIIQIFSKKVFHRKVFRIAPIHHHFEALGWPSYKVVMRFWIISIIFAMIGVIVALWGTSIG